MNYVARILGIALVASIATSAVADDFGTPPCPGSQASAGALFISFDASYTLYTLNMTTAPDGSNVITRQDVSAAELASLCSEGFDVEAFPDSTAQGSYFPVVVEFYNAALDHYFLTADVQEISDLDNGVHPGWKRKNWPDRWVLETPDAFAVHLPNSSDGTCPPGTSPLYRLFNNRADVNHRYTTSLAIREQMIEQAWIPEGYGTIGVAMCVRPS